MLRPTDPWFLDEAVEDPTDLVQVLPEIRQYLAPPPPEEELGLRSLLEQPGHFTHAWWRAQAGKSRGKYAGPSRHHAA
jgi:hypothetical protein